MVTETSRTCLIILIFLSIFGVFSGIIGILVLSLKFCWQCSTKLNPNYRYASIAYAGLSSVLALWNVVLHTMHLQDIWRTWLKGLRLFLISGVLFICFNVFSFFGFIIFSAVNHEEISPNSFYVASIWCAWGSLWSIMLYICAKRYRNEYADLTALLDF